MADILAFFGHFMSEFSKEVGDRALSMRWLVEIGYARWDSPSIPIPRSGFTLIGVSCISMLCHLEFIEKSTRESDVGV